MLRQRLAWLALAAGSLITLPGCCAFCEDGRLFPRLFRHGARSAPNDCECRNLPPHLMMEHAAQGPVLAPGASASGLPTITNIPANQPPKVFQTAPTTPYVPGAN